MLGYSLLKGHCSQDFSPCGFPEGKTMDSLFMTLQNRQGDRNLFILMYIITL